MLTTVKLSPESLKEFFQKLAIASASHVDTLTFLKLLKEDACSYELREVAPALLESVMNGDQLSQAVRASGVFDAVSVSVLVFGEKSHSLKHCAQTHLASLEAKLANRGVNWKVAAAAGATAALVAIGVLVAGSVFVLKAQRKSRFRF